ncbi:hypothetical protein MPTK1_8g06890 [Marchantia polymorpha subsp. ruderalis]|uniref:Uncharacterized protein n=1 Tax=Marchantia polymorpha TaxID=3197 RepID=A0A2R6XIE0_MARPO|nr:hypothetical protein MARPO_0013s0103 [Marchantia polymorpha]BBN18968.1 hypothetical protein Mp_8g06890 [Marchantia polymorpha subsp. ruderalis]|eukprot:PTQ45878.1 hypothetical protein MARPO_0013s0103 [Marchantia polymorpha]
MWRFYHASYRKRCGWCIRMASEGPNSKATMVPQEMELEFGRTYVLVPLPRLFDKVKDVRHSRPTSCFPRSLCLGPGGQGFPTLSDSDDNEATFTRRAKGRVTLGSLLALHTGCLGLVRKKYKDSIRSPSALKLQRILAKAEMNWRCTCVETRSWRPELESIKEEARKNSLSRRFEFSLIENHRPLEPAP